MTNCPICGATPILFNTDGAVHAIKCRVCGSYLISGTAVAVLPKPGSTPDRRPFLSAYIRQANARDVVPKILSDNWERFSAAHEHTSVMRKLEMVLQYLAMKSEYPGDKVEILGNDDYPLFDARSSKEVSFLVQALTDRSDIVAATGGRWQVSAKGWDRLSPIAPGGVPGTCFVAMAFDKSLDAAFDEGAGGRGGL